ncbi:MAG: SPOR domain-containing protein [Alcanivoracaceae bacterium]|nr:SPOR domain-containing protein [Alcanivoracaceae bacterium]
MRWVFFSLLILNVVYLVFALTVRGGTPPQPSGSRVASVAPASLVLLSETGAPMVPSQRGPDVPPLCPVVGPWEAYAQADQAMQPLARAGYQVSVEQVKVARDRLHWVYLPSSEDKEQALRLLRELQAKGVDSFVVAEGGDANAISLGYFSSADSARGLMVKMQTAGYPAQIRETYRESTEFWLRVAANTIADDGAALRSLLAANSTLTGNHVACESPVLIPTQEEKLSPDM